jgi:hypothetical protein
MQCENALTFNLVKRYTPRSMKRNKFLKAKLGTLVASTLVAFVVVGCAKDQTLDEYHDKEAEQDVARLNAFAGSYTGTLTNTDTNQSIGAMEIDLKTQLTTTPNADNTENTISAGLGGQSIISTAQNPVGIGTITSATCDAYNDSSTCPFSGTITATLSNNTTASLSISGTISGNTFTGNFTSTSGITVTNNSFTLTKSNVAAGTAQLGNGHQPSPTADRHKYKGSYQSINLAGAFEPGSKGQYSQPSSTQSVYLTIENASSTPAENFINAISSEPLVTVSMNSQDPDITSSSLTNVNTSFADVYLNETNGLFIAKSSPTLASGATCNETLTCNQSGGSYNASVPWSCNYASSCGNTINFTANPAN